MDTPSLEFRMTSGRHFPLGVRVHQGGVNFAVYSPDATGIDLCFFDHQDQEIQRFRLPERTRDVWHGFVENCAPGSRYAFRVHGPFDPAQGFWFNPNRIVLDPYAQAISQPIQPNAFMFAHDLTVKGEIVADESDNASNLPKCVVPEVSEFDWQGERPFTSWRETLIYELHVKGFSALHPEVPEPLRGTYLGVAHPASINHLVSLGITTVELMPCMAFMPEHRIVEFGLTNYWGYNPLFFFAPEPRYAVQNANEEFKIMVDALHVAGIEVVLDVVYNHTAEGGMLGPVLTSKGLHARSFYRYVDGGFTHFINNSGTGNSVNTHDPYASKMVLDSMRHWMTEYHIDGFRFDLAASLGREHWDFNPESAFFKSIMQDPLLSTAKLIAEPWDIGRNGYQLGNFPDQWYECNDKFRDTVRRFWKGDSGVLADFATRLMGSSDVFQKGSTNYSATVNYVTYHDGFTLHDLVSYNNRHNAANKEHNLDGHGNNLSYNYGVEGETLDSQINAVRARQKRNLIATLLLSQGAVHLLGGDEIGRTQQGNNNAYCQDNEISWFNWQEADADLMEFTRQMIALRKSSELFNNLVLKDQQNVQSPYTSDEVHWFNLQGKPMEIKDWHNETLKTFAMLLSSDVKDSVLNLHLCEEYYLVMFNADVQPVTFAIPVDPVTGWHVLCDTALNEGLLTEEPVLVKGQYRLHPQSLVVLGRAF